MVGKAASTDGSTIATHTADCGTCDWTWRHVDAADHKPGATRKIYHINQYKTWPLEQGLKWDLIKNDFTGLEIPEPAHTYAYHHAMFGYLNENQVGIGESTIGCVRKLENSTPTPKFDITMLTLRGHGALEDGPRGHPDHGDARRKIRLRVQRRRRDAGRPRPERGLDLRDHAGRAAVDAQERQARRGLVRPARSRRPRVRLPQRVADRRGRPQEHGLFHGLGPHGQPGRRAGALRPERRPAVQLEAGLQPRRGERRQQPRPPGHGCGGSSISWRPRSSSAPRPRTWISRSRSSPTKRSRSRM